MRRFVLICCALAACSRGVRKDVTPPLAEQAPAEAAAQAAIDDPSAGAALTPDEALAHVLSRTTFGARPGDLERVRRVGISAFLEEQLHPERIEDSRTDARLAGYQVLERSAGELARALYDFRKKQQEAKKNEVVAPPPAPPDAGPLTAAEAARRAAAPQQADEPVKAAGPAADAAPQMAEAAPKADDAAPKMASAQRDEPGKKGRGGGRELRKSLGRAGRGPGFDFVAELSEAKLVRAVSSERQLQEVMTDFWFNHFNVFAGKEFEAALLPSYEKDAIRPNALGSFGDLVRATAHSPAMLVYLDNWRSTSSQPPAQARRYSAWLRARRGGGDEPPKKPKGNRRGLNENYARELLELHTMGVDGGYTQADVTEVARCFTGWTVADPQDGPRYVFRPQLHDDGVKHVLGHVIPAGQGERDGEEVLELILAQPATAHFVAQKLARRFVSDDPPEALVARVAATYARTHGDIRSMLRTIFEAPEFWSRRALKSKVRSPLELVAASVRALGATVDDALPLARQVARIGEPLYGAQPPTGYGDTAQAWVSSGALLARIDFGLLLASGQLEGVAVDLQPLAQGGPEEILERAQERLAARALSDKTREYILGQLREVPQKPQLVAARAVGLLLGAPELQRR